MENNNPPDNNKNNNDQNQNFNSPSNQNPYGNQNPQNFNQAQYQSPYQQGNYSAQKPAVPNATAGLVLGIIGLFFSIICVYWVAAFLGLVMSIIALVISSRAVKTFNETPGLFSSASLGNAKAGKILGLIGLIVAILWFIFLALILTVATSFAHAFKF
jgi:hypothetical protein